MSVAAVAASIVLQPPDHKELAMGLDTRRCHGMIRNGMAGQRPMTTARSHHSHTLSPSRRLAMSAAAILI